MISWVQTVTVVAAVGGLMMAYIKLNHLERAELKGRLFRWTAYAGCVLMVGSSANHILQFGLTEGPVTHREVLWVLLNLWNGAVYLIAGITLSAIWTRLSKQELKTPEAVPTKQDV
jgi:hypothetical protein